MQKEQVVCRLQRLADLGFLAVLLLAPWFMGGRHPQGRLVLAAIVSVTGIAWGGSQWLGRRPRWSWSGAELILLLAVGLVVLQLLPLPYRVLARLSPSLPETLPLWSDRGPSAALWGTWHCTSLTPAATREGLCMLLVYGVLFLATYQRLQQLADIEWLLRWVAVAVIAMAIVGLLQYLAGNGKFLWIYAHPWRDTQGAVKGAFANQNHLAQFLALGLGPLIWWLRHELVRCSPGRDRFSAFAQGRRADAASPLLLTGGMAVVVLAILLTCSRGGILAMTGGVFACLMIYACRSLIDKRTLLVLTASLVLVVVAVWVRGEERLGTKVATLTSGSLDQLDGSHSRRNVWAACMRAMPDYLFVGSGVGSHRDIYPRYFPQWSDVEYTHTENGYLQVLLETGVCGLVLLLAGGVLISYWLFASLRRAASSSVTACGGAVAAGCVVSASHSLVDFVWYLPSCMSVVVMLIAAAARLYRITRPRGSGGREPSVAWPAGVFALAVAGLTIGWIHTLIGPARAAATWDNYLAISLAAGTSASDGVRIGRQQQFGRVDLADPATLARMASYLQQSLRQNPHDARAQLRYATVCLRRFEQLQQASDNAMGLLDLREAARGSQFATRQARQQWLAAVIGERRVYLDEARRAAMRAVQLCPLQGQAYLHLAELAFLNHSDPDFGHRLLEQARRVRPYDGMVLFCLGREAVLGGKWDEGLQYWRQAFSHDPHVRQTIIHAVAPQVSADVLLTILQPDQQGLGALYQYYRQQGQDAPAREVGAQYVVKLEQHAAAQRGVEAAQSWDAVQWVYAYLGQFPQAVHAARQAVRFDSGDYRLHAQLGERLGQNQEWAAAEAEYQWCLNRRPDDLVVWQQRATARQKRYEADQRRVANNVLLPDAPR